MLLYLTVLASVYVAFVAYGTFNLSQYQRNTEQMHLNIKHLNQCLEAEKKVSADWRELAFDFQGRLKKREVPSDQI